MSLRPSQGLNPRLSSAMSALKIESVAMLLSTEPNALVNEKTAVELVVKDPDTSGLDSPNTVDLVGDLKMSLDSKAPPLTTPYSMANSMCDLPGVAYALELFMASHMLESEEYINKSDPKKYDYWLDSI